MATIREIFSSGPEFCNLCGSILPVRTGTASDYSCHVCRAPIVRKPSVIGARQNEVLESVSYEVHFNNSNVYSSKRKNEEGQKNINMADGPLVNRDCKQCGHNQMSYATAQLRSADEGQTVFFTCTKCKFKESENS